MSTRFKKQYVEETIFEALMIVSFVIVILSLGSILYTILARGLPALNWEILTQVPKGGYYLGKEGGILNAIVGSLYLAGGGTLLALVMALPAVLGLNYYAKKETWANTARLAMDTMWGIPSIVYGAFGLSVMLFFGMRASLLAGIVVLALLEFPILTRSIDEFIRMVPQELSEATYALGATRLETAITLLRQILPGIATAILLAFGRGIGDAASVLFTAGYTDRIPDSLTAPVASLPLAVFFQLGTPFPQVQARAYASALVLTFIILITSLGSRLLSNWLGRFAIK